MLCSFGYGLPILVISGMDKLNPRLYDIVFIMGLFLFSKKIFTKDTNPVMIIWRKTIIWMLVCALITFVLVPSTVGVFSLYYWFKYFQGYLVVKMLRECLSFTNIRLLEYVFIGIGLFVSYYSIPQFFGLDPVEVEIAEGKTYTVAAGMMVGPYSSTYFALAQIMPFCLLFCVNHIIRESKHRIIFVAIAILFFFVGTYCGSRTAFLLTAGSLLVFCFIHSPSKFISFSAIVVLSICLLFALSGQFRGAVDDFIEGNQTLERAQSLNDDEEDSSKARMSIYKDFRISEYDYGLLMPFVGSGFYVSPKLGSFRIGYGFHNNYVFAFEQLGIYGLYLFLILLLRVLKVSNKYRKKNDISKMVLAFTLVLCVANMAGQIFWQGFGTCEMNTLIIYLMALSVEPSIQS